jgi:hypothetical protein
MGDCCYFCNKGLTSEEAKESYCWGCKVFVCEECDINFNMPLGSHEPEVHRKETDDA